MCVTVVATGYTSAALGHSTTSVPISGAYVPNSGHSAGSTPYLTPPHDGSWPMDPLADPLSDLSAEDLESLIANSPLTEPFNDWLASDNQAAPCSLSQSMASTPPLSHSPLPHSALPTSQTTSPVMTPSGTYSSMTTADEQRSFFPAASLMSQGCPPVQDVSISPVSVMKQGKHMIRGGGEGGGCGLKCRSSLIE